MALLSLRIMVPLLKQIIRRNFSLYTCFGKFIRYIFPFSFEYYWMYTILLFLVLQMQMNIYTTLWPIFHPFSFRIKKWKIGRLLQRVQSKPIKTLFLLHVISQSFVYIVMQSSWERTDMHLNSDDWCSLNDVVFL